ncbi:hypothetical protein [Bacillus sp. RO1]|uniref:hypothetical protein n=1 Tax=Bacillus sp. RO1 TaxID=2722703 RepID=UPI0014564511|nr:hypothetical protein [Bacillus sp. RO1]NLP52054.1 hypothetical protein [Bacillus sp. RO1]
MFTKNARQIERAFIRKAIKTDKVITLKGKDNYIFAINSSYVTLQTENGRKPFGIARKAIRKAINFLLDCKTITRRQLQRFSNFTSALLAILMTAFQGKVIVKGGKNGEARISLTVIRLYASGLERDPYIRNVLKKLGGKHLLLNYYHIRGNKNWKRILDDFHCIIDSGAFSIFKTKQKQKKEVSNQLELFDFEEVEMISLEEYASFINNECHDTRIKAFINLDVIGDPIQTKTNYERLKHLCPAATIWPVWQFSDSFESLQELVEQEPDVICIGGIVPEMNKNKGTVKEKLDRLFNQFPGVNFHCLGLANRWLWEYKFFSFDTTAFLNSRKSKKQRKIYNDKTGERLMAPAMMSTLSIITQNLESLLKLENLQEKLLQI